MLLLICSSCDEEKDLNTNEFTLNSESLQGFIFEDLIIIEYPNTENQKPDFWVSAQTNDYGDVIAPFLSHPDLESKFALLQQHENFDNARNYFDSYSIVEEPRFQQFGFNVQSNQVWLIKTNTGGFGKIIIIDSHYSNIDNKPFAEITFKAESIY